jgi:hypothetical protein
VYSTSYLQGLASDVDKAKALVAKVKATYLFVVKKAGGADAQWSLDLKSTTPGSFVLY